MIICDTGVALLAYMNGTDPRTLGAVALVVAAALAASIYKVSLLSLLFLATFCQVDFQ